MALRVARRRRVSVARRLFFGGRRCRRLVLAARPPYRAAQEVGLLVRLLEPIASTRLAASLHRIGMALLGRRTVLHRGAPLYRAVPIPTIAIAVTAVAETALVAPEGSIVPVRVAVGVIAT
jgi:hypothetical protein